jgi:hypothetical protein
LCKLRAVRFALCAVRFAVWVFRYIGSTMAEYILPTESVVRQDCGGPMSVEISRVIDYDSGGVE